MAGSTINQHIVLAIADYLCHGLVQIEPDLSPVLTKISYLQISAPLDGAAIWGQFTHKQVQQGAFTYAVVTDQANPITTHQPECETFDQPSIIVAE